MSDLSNGMVSGRPEILELLDSHAKPILKNLNLTSKSIDGSALITRDGLNISAAMSKSFDRNRCSAMFASLISLAKSAARELQRGNVRHMLIESASGWILMVYVGDKAILSIITQPNVNIGMIFVEARRTAAELAKIVKF